MKDGFHGQRSYRLPVPLLHEAAAHPLCQGLHLTDIGFYPVAKAHKRTRRTGSAQYILLYCVQGSGWYQLNQAEKYTLRAGQWIILPAHVPHKYAADETTPWTIYWLHFTGTQAAALYTYLMEHTPAGPATVLPTDERFQLFEELFSQLTLSATLAGVVQASARLPHFLLALLPSATHPAQLSPAAHSIAHSIRFMREHLARSFTVAELAAQAGLSASYYSAVFRAQTGRSPIVFFNFLKMQEACQQLAYSKLRIKEVAGQLGFDDVYYFSRVFTKLMGLSPRQFRQADRG
ncbi:AraC family transcriptional regulator [Hymenobacter sp. BT186]|uniref:AraC family transcriptional regulator n=1 Tax=Hymenobacter telluris TaxID=2816474 RepID=A0A939EZW7_9BACT|nr:AraC family transcriptional regulator [Hymenobacter telluris]MBO0360558.1 AraC family transcriptional regulator [Hymenobacter telluris]MBW3376585.1 AraC family transcriptional regulator [Hymenobacter norwichensis]